MPSRSHNFTLPVLETDKQLMNYLSANLTESIKQFIRMAIKTMVKEEMVSYKQEVSALIVTRPR